MSTIPKSNVYTRGGDKGRTSLVGGTRVSKTHPRLEAYGTVDELNSWIGLLAAEPLFDSEVSDTDCTASRPDIRALLTGIQHRLFDIGSILATEEGSGWQPDPFPEAAVKSLEQEIDLIDSLVPKHNRFVLPGGSIPSAKAQVARTVARRAERRILTLADSYPVEPPVIAYINRLSDLLFVIARYAMVLEGKEEIFWEKFTP